MGSFGDLVRRKSERLRRKMGKEIASGEKAESGFSELKSSEDSLFRNPNVSQSSSTSMVINPSKTYRRSLDSMASIFLPRIGSLDKVSALTDSLQRDQPAIPTNNSCGKGGKPFYLNQQSSSCSDVFHIKQRSRRSTSPVAPNLGLGTFAAGSRTAMTKFAQQHGEVIYVPELSADRDLGPMGGKKKFRRSVDAATLRRAGKRVVSEPTVGAYNNTFSHQEQTVSINSKILNTTQDRFPHEYMSNGKSARDQPVNTAGELAFNLVFHTLNIVLTLFFYIPIWIGLQLAKYGSGLLGAGLVVLLCYGLYTIFFQASRVILVSFLSTIY